MLDLYKYVIIFVLLSNQNNKNMDFLHKELRTMRLKAGMSQMQLAVKTGLSIGTISQFENGSAQSLRNLKLYAEAMGVEVCLRPVGEQNDDAEPEAPPADWDNF